MGEQVDLAFSYGKLGIPVYRFAAAPLEGVRPIPESTFTGRPNAVFCYEVELEAFGQAFLPSYTEGNNEAIVATDSMKNFVLRKALDFPGATPEAFLDWLGRAFLDQYPHVERVRLTATEIPFAPVSVPQDGRAVPSPIAFRRHYGERAWTTVTLERAADGFAVTDQQTGVLGLELMKVTRSAFTGYIRDEFTTLPETTDRPLYIALDVRWRYQRLSDLLDPTHAGYVAPEQVRDLLAVVFEEVYDQSIQQLLYLMGGRVLERFPQLGEVAFVAQNRTRQLVAEDPADRRRRVFTDPFPAYGCIRLTMRRCPEGGSGWGG